MLDHNVSWEGFNAQGAHRDPKVARAEEKNDECFASYFLKIKAKKNVKWFEIVHI